MARQEAGSEEQEGAARGTQVTRALSDAEQHGGQPGRTTGQHRGQARLLVYARGRYGGAEVEIDDERLFGDASPELRRQ